MRILLGAAAWLFASCSQSPIPAHGPLCIASQFVDAAAGTVTFEAMLVEGAQIVERRSSCDGLREEGIEILNLGGRYVIPGLINTHSHVGSTSGLEYRPRFYTEENLLRQLSQYARFGVTTVMSMGDDRQAGFALRDRQMKEPPSTARLLVAGPVPAPLSPAHARRLVRRIAASRPNVIKLRVDDYFGRRSKTPWAILDAMIDEAALREVPVAAHVFYLKDAKKLAARGVAILSRSIRDKVVDEEFISLAKKQQLCVSPALSREWVETAYSAYTSFLDDPLLVSSQDESLLNAFRSPHWYRRYENSRRRSNYAQALEVAKRNLKILSDSGVRIALGSDSGLPGRFEGYFEVIEMELMQKAGMSPGQILVSATANAAACLRQENRVGSLEPGFAADFVVLRSNPLDDIQNVREVESVWIAGRPVFEATSPPNGVFQ